MTENERCLLYILTYQWWIESRTVHTNWWIRILIGWWIRCTVNADASRWYARIARQRQSRWIILTRTNCLPGYRIGHNWTTIFAAWLHWSSGRVRCLWLSTGTYSTTWNTCCWSTTRTYRWSTAVIQIKYTWNLTQYFQFILIHKQIYSVWKFKFVKF